jgi:hypothetical protein
MTACIDDDVLDAFVPSGTHERIGGLLRDAFEGLAACVTLPMPADATLDAAHARALSTIHE